MPRGEIRGMEVSGYYVSDYYSLNENMLVTVRNAKNGDINALAELRELFSHEAVHRKRETSATLFSHDHAFYKEVEESLLRMVA